MDALVLCQELVGGLDEAASVAARNAFIDHTLLPAANAQGEHGWCVSLKQDLQTKCCWLMSLFCNVVLWGVKTINLILALPKNDSFGH